MYKIIGSNKGHTLIASDYLFIWILNDLYSKRTVSYFSNNSSLFFQ